MRGYIGFVLSP